MQFKRRSFPELLAKLDDLNGSDTARFDRIWDRARSLAGTYGFSVQDAFITALRDNGINEYVEEQ